MKNILGVGETITMERISLSLYSALAVFCLFIQHGSCANHANGTDAKNLRKKLFVTDEYDKTVRPTNTQDKPIFVRVSLLLLSINELNEKTETLKTTGYLYITWKDEFLQWNPEDYGGIFNYQWPQGDVWKPDVTLTNSYEDYKELGAPSLNVDVYSNGTVEWYPFQVFQSTCSVDITYFPYDIQECKLKFGAWSYTKDEVTMLVSSFDINPDSTVWWVWVVYSSNYEVLESGEAAVVFTLKIGRKPLHVLFLLIMPVIMLAILNIFVFVIPCESGEKASFAITVFLAFVVFLSIISSIFPENSESVPLFSIYLIIQTLQSTIISLLALLLIRCSSFDDKTPVPRCIRAFLSVFSCRPCRARKGRNRIADYEVAIKMEESNNENPPLADENAETSVSPEQIVYSDYSWKDVTKTFNKGFFVLFLLVLITSTMYFGVSVAVYALKAYDIVA